MRGEYVHEDYVFWLELLQKGATFHGISQPLVEYRLLPGSRSADKFRSSWGRWRLLRDYLKLPLPRAAACQAHYVVRGLRKHYFTEGAMKTWNRRSWRGIRAVSYTHLKS